jgi:hypothetical protein
MLEPPRPQRAARQLASGTGEEATMTSKLESKDLRRVIFELAADLEPDLKTLLEEARSHRKKVPDLFCANAVYYGDGDQAPGLRPRLDKIVGGGARKGKAHPVLKSWMVYDVVTDVIYETLPDCRGGCLCG